MGRDVFDISAVLSLANAHTFMAQKRSAEAEACLDDLIRFNDRLEAIMADDTSKTGGQDRDRINVNQDYELRNWAKSMNTTPERVKEAVKAVGDRADKVREYIESKPRTS
jgi:ElaB/YqjD/DUF883 family membrane-anchored ribosome-binding protein